MELTLMITNVLNYKKGTLGSDGSNGMDLVTTGGSIFIYQGK